MHAFVFPSHCIYNRPILTQARENKNKYGGVSRTDMRGGGGGGGGFGGSPGYRSGGGFGSSGSSDYDSYSRCALG